MNVNLEYCDPFQMKDAEFWMKIEHCGRYMWAADFMKEHSCKRIADLASANGYGTWILASSLPDAQLIGEDRNPTYIEEARHKYFLKNIAYACRDFDDGKFPDEWKSLDVIVSFETLEHVNYPEKLLEKFFRGLRKGGWLLLSIPNTVYEKFDEDGKNKDPYHRHVWSRTRTEMNLKEKGFTIIEVLGQAICNQMVGRLAQLHERGKMDIDWAEARFPADEDTIKLFSMLAGYPVRKDVDKSYSYIYVCRK